MTMFLEDAIPDISKNRDDVIEKLVQFSIADMLLFWGQEKELIIEQEKIWEPILNWAGKEFSEELKYTHSLSIDDVQPISEAKLKIFFEKLSDKELASFYFAALKMRSLLLAAAFIKGAINAEEAYNASYVEEVYQAKLWGIDVESEAVRLETLKQLKEIELFLK